METVLIVEDRESDIVLMEEALKNGGLDFRLERADNADDRSLRIPRPFW